MKYAPSGFPVEQPLSVEYSAALESHDIALRAYDEIVKLYRAGKISDDEYLKARAARVAADQLFDAAWQKESESC